MDKSMHTHSPEAETCKALFGEMPEDVIDPLNCAAEALLWLNEICTTIKSEALDRGNGYRIKRLADAGAYLAQAFGDHARYRHETMLRQLHGAGIVTTISEGGDHG